MSGHHNTYNIVLILIFIVPVGMYQLCVENNNRLRPTLFMFLLKDESDYYVLMYYVLIWLVKEKAFCLYM
jgi:hypothetical protein